MDVLTFSRLTDVLFLKKNPYLAEWCETLGDDVETHSANVTAMKE